MESTVLKSRLLAAFAANVRKARQAKGLSQEQLAAEAGLHRTYVGLVERRLRAVSILTIEKLADALDLPAASLLAEQGAARAERRP